MPRKIDLNVDIGEGFGFDAKLLKIATSANVCCGVHAGSQGLALETAAACQSNQVKVGAHPGYPDRKSMGRLSLKPGQETEYLASLAQQISWFCQNIKAAYIKPHGGFYNDLATVMGPGWDSMLAHPGSKSPYEAGGQELSKVSGTGLLIVYLRIYKIPLMGLAGTFLEEIGRRAGHGFIKEGFADRAYTESGLLVPRNQPGAVLRSIEEITDQSVRLAETCDSICVHGDTEGAVEIATKVREVLTSKGFLVSV